MGAKKYNTSDKAIREAMFEYVLRFGDECCIFPVFKDLCAVLGMDEGQIKAARMRMSRGKPFDVILPALKTYNATVEKRRSSATELSPVAVMLRYPDGRQLRQQLECAGEGYYLHYPDGTDEGVTSCDAIEMIHTRLQSYV